MIKKKRKLMKKKEVFGVDGVYSPPNEEKDGYHLPYKNPPKIKTEEEEKEEERSKPTFLKRLYNKIRNKKEAF